MEGKNGRDTLMSGKGKRVFRPAKPEKWRNNAIIGGISSRFAYDIGFKEAGDILVEKASSGYLQDALFFPICSCYCHCIEVCLKDLIRQVVGLIRLKRKYGETIEIDISDRGLSKKYGIKKLSKGHCIENLAELLRDVFNTVSPEEKFNHEIMDYLIEIDSIDPFGQSFRYYTDTKGNVIFPTQQHIDLRRIKRLIKKIYDYCTGMHCWLSE